MWRACSSPVCVMAWWQRRASSPLRLFLTPAFHHLPARSCSLSEVDASLLQKIRPPGVSLRDFWNDDHLRKALKAEITQDADEQASYKVIPPGLPEPFQLVDTPGTTDIIIRRAYKNEEISVSCFVDADYPESDEDEEQDDQSEDEPPLQKCLYMKICITKGTDKPFLEIICCYEKNASEDIVIERVSYIEDQPFNLGPYFRGLPSNLQRAFLNLIKDRGITPDLGDFINDYLIKKYRSEYIRWRHNILSFVTR